MTHMSMTSTPLAVAADYADALVTARKARTLLFSLLLVLLAAQLSIFFLAKYDVLKLVEPTPVPAATVAAVASPATAESAASQPAAAAVAPEAAAATKTVPAISDVGRIVCYATPLVTFAVVGLSILMVATLLLIEVIMLVGRLVGASHVAAAFVWAVLLVVLLFPWQTFLIQTEHYPVAGASSGVAEQPAFKWPGAVYTWPELRRDHKFANEPLGEAIWLWARYAGLPGLSLLVLLLVQFKSGRGLKFALGEADVHVDVTTRTDQVGM